MVIGVEGYGVPHVLTGAHTWQPVPKRRGQHFGGEDNSVCSIMVLRQEICGGFCG